MNLEDQDAANAPTKHHEGPVTTGPIHLVLAQLEERTEENRALLSNIHLALLRLIVVVRQATVVVGVLLVVEVLLALLRFGLDVLARVVL